MQLIERVAEHYEVQEVAFGRVYRWCPERVVVECKCGKRAIHKRADLISREVSACECGKDDLARIRAEVVLEVVDEDYESTHHPWRYWHPPAGSGIPF